jgi:hypothetical protein
MKSETFRGFVPAAPRMPTLADLASYQLDAWQRGVLFLDVMRRRSEQARRRRRWRSRMSSVRGELVCDGRTLERPVNYLLVRILPPKGAVPDARKRPFVVVDPRAGHGPGIGGFKADSEIGVAMRAGHPATSSASCPIPSPARPSRTSRWPRRASSRW